MFRPSATYDKCDKSTIKQLIRMAGNVCATIMHYPIQYYVYIVASRRNGTLYTGITNDLLQRTSQHKNAVIEGFTKRYGVHRLVWYETHGDINDAIHREKCIEKWRRVWKLYLIEAMNPYWEDLYEKLL